MKSVPNIAIASPSCSAAKPFTLWRRVKALVSGHRPRQRRVLDVRTLSDHLKRDIGALDGNDPRGPRP